MFYSFLFFMLATSVNAKWSVPENVKFSVNKFSDMRCQNSMNSTTELVFFCPNSDDVNGKPACCFDILNKFAPFENPSFDKCYRLSINNVTDFINY